MRFLLPVAICSLLSLTSAYAEGEPFLTFYQDPGCPEGTGLDVRKQDMQRCIVMPGLRPQGQSIRLHPQEGAKGCLQIYTGAECTGEITYGYNIDRGNRPGCYPMDLSPADLFPQDASYYAYFPDFCKGVAGELEPYAPA